MISPTKNRSQVRDVLLVSHDHHMADVLWAILEPEGFRMTHKRHCATALETVTQHSFSLILLELMTPPTLTCLEDCRRLYTATRLPIIVLNGKRDVAAAIQTLRVGAVDYLVKPVDPQLLLAKLHALARLFEAESGKPSSPPRIAPGLEMDLDRHVVMVRGGRCLFPEQSSGSCTT